MQTALPTIRVMRPVQKMYGVIGGGVIVDLLPAVPSQCIVIERATAMHLRCTRAARVIQTVWLQCYYIPTHPMCLRRLLRELERLQNTPKM